MDIECLQQIQKNQDQIVYNSGHFFAEMGLWQECIDSNFDSSFYMAYFINNNTKLNATLFMGMCLPSVCSKDFVKDLMNQYLQPMQPFINATFRAPLAVGTVDVNPQTYSYPGTYVYYITITILSLLAFASIFSIFWGWKKKKERYSTFDKIVETFNPVDGMSIFKYKSNYLNIFNGIKVICMFWVIMGHLFTVRVKYDINITSVNAQIQKPFFLVVLATFLSVDVFFFIGGFLVAYSFMREKSKSILKYPMAILHRLLRFWPSYIMIILIYYSVFIHTGDGPLWKQNMIWGQIPNCEQGWKTLLFVGNLVDNGAQLCMPWGWYLQNDMQIFVFSMFFIYAYMRNRKIGYIAMILMMCLGLGLNFYQVFKRNIVQITHLKDLAKWNEYFLFVYIKPWIRCPPYIFGLICGLLHMEYLQIRKKLKDDPENPIYKANFFLRLRELMLEKRYVSWLSQIVGLMLMVATIVVIRDLQVGHVWPQWAHAFHISFEKITYTLGVYLVVLPTMLQVPNMSFFLLDTKFFNAISKISFWVYLIHFMVIMWVTFGEKVDFYFGTQSIVIPLFFSVAVISCFYGFLGTMLIEVPFSKLQKMLFSVLLKKKSKPIQNAESILANGKESIVQPLSSSVVSDRELNESLLKNEGINRSLKE